MTISNEGITVISLGTTIVANAAITWWRTNEHARLLAEFGLRIGRLENSDSSRTQWSKDIERRMSDAEDEHRGGRS